MLTEKALNEKATENDMKWADRYRIHGPKHIRFFL